jgi:hypothetical protein
LHFLELGLGFLVAGVPVRMILFGQLAISFLDVFFGSLVGYA